MADKWILTSNESVSGMRCGVEVNSRNVEKSIDLDRAVFFDKGGKRKTYVPVRTCTMTPDEGYCTCSNCGEELYMHEGYDPWEKEYTGKYCLECGAKVVE